MATQERLQYLERFKASPACRIALGDPADDLHLEQPETPLYAAQDSLPLLPVPPLRETCAAYLHSLAPFATEAELKRSRAAVEAFCRPGGLGEELQRRLKARATAAAERRTSWLAAWWHHYGYLAYREPVPINVSYFLHFTDLAGPAAAGRMGQVRRAATLMHYVCDFWERWKAGQVPQERVGRKGTPLCSAAYKYLFNSCRVPAREADVYAMYEPRRHDHVVVFCRGAPYCVDVLNPHTNELLAPEELEHHLESILLASASTRAAPAGVMTGWHRDKWTEAREELLRLRGNAEVLAAVESAVFVLCLDASVPVTRTQVARELLHSDGRNRWFDKPLQFVVFQNGKAGLLAEHAMMDGMPVSRMMSEVLRNAEQHAAQPPRSTVAGTVQRMSFRLDHVVASSIAAAAADLDHFTQAHEYSAVVFHGYGSRAIKKWKMSPDAFVQVAMQLAYRRMVGHYAPTYEATQTRKFRHGRTETTRSCTAEAVAFVDTVLRGAPSADQLQRLRAATAAHSACARRAAEGRGVDRHLFGLKRLLRDGEEADLLLDPLFGRSQTWEVSTSTLVDRRFDGWGYGEVTPQGVGLAYMVKDRTMHFTVSARKDKSDGSPAMLCHHLEEAFVQLGALCDAEAVSEPAAPPRLRGKL